MALSGLTASSRPSSLPLSSRLPCPPPPSPALLFLSSRGLSGVCRASITYNGDLKTRPLLLARAASADAHQYEEDFGGSVSQFIDVIAIGSRKDAVLDFCVDSPLSSKKYLRFWSFTTNSAKVYLQQRLLNKDVSTLRKIEAIPYLQSHSKATVLVASAGYGLDDSKAIDILESVRYVNGYTTAIILRPFSFEGQRRKNEVNNLVGTLLEHTHCCIDINTDVLLEKDVVTLDEALKTANNAVLLAINAISVLTSDYSEAYLAVRQRKMRKLTIAEVFQVLQCYKEANIGFGSGYNIRTSIGKAIFQCPFLSYGIKDLNGVLLCILASSEVNESINSHTFLDNFRQVTGYEGEVILYIVDEPNFEANLLVTTVVALGSIESLTPQKSNLLSRLAQHFPFLFNFLRKERQINSIQSKDSLGNANLEDMHSGDTGKNDKHADVALVGKCESFDINHGQMLAFSQRNLTEVTLSSQDERINEGQWMSDIESTSFGAPEAPAFQREPLHTWDFGPGYVDAQEWAKERTKNAAASSTLNNLSIFHLPVGVRPSGESKEFMSISNVNNNLVKEEMVNNVKASIHADSSMPSWSGLTDVSFGAMKDVYNAASTVLKRKEADVPKKQGILSVRAASMLEAERDSPKKWNPIVEMQYRGGFYKGRCQGGLPEGKGHLALGDGSRYDGMWRYGKRSGAGTFYFSNGDVFQGSWRDDVMHGKGWFYFHTGDRWFANFWKGKANGEGRFYTKSGEVLFGQFKDGWRHGQFLSIKVDGRRHVEIWDEGVLISSEQLDSDM
ncbi:hypothetical protein SAY86_018875 [Trapa natans]|uniref:Protein ACCUMULATION AND REPLICATION OF CHLOROPLASTS 3 n=1 Tax=Trapa natans TaxID=22666 RepID=A0AAN7LRT1_TRANT|nr:hypothetical protein SAY86_018875 [Trapa natans]